MYELISNLKPYFFSLREVGENVSLDIRIPTTWKLEHVQEVVKQYKSMNFKVQDKNDKFQLVSLISVANEEGYETARLCAVEIIGHNLEMEQKDRLFKQKVDELKALFKNQSLDKLKELNFLEEDEQRDTKGIDLVGEGDGEGSESDRSEQAEDDRGNQESGQEQTVPTSKKTKK